MDCRVEVVFTWSPPPSVLCGQQMIEGGQSACSAKSPRGELTEVGLSAFEIENEARGGPMLEKEPVDRPASVPARCTRVCRILGNRELSAVSRRARWIRGMRRARMLREREGDTPHFLPPVHILLGDEKSQQSGRSRARGRWRSPHATTL